MGTPDPQQRERLMTVIREGAVRVVFQPIVDANDGLVVAYEALTRVAPESGFTGPEELFHSAEDQGLLWELERVTRRAALSAAANWPREVRLFINNSPRVFADERFTQTLLEELEEQPELSADRIVLEITEMAESSDDSRLLEQVEQSKRAGFHVAVDDAGAGTSGLNRMMVLRPHWIKLDRSFCRGIDQDGLKQNLVRFFVHFAKLSNVNVVAEGIESAAELGSIISLGVRFAQGFFLGKPGERSATMDPEFVAAVRERWASVEANVPETPHDMPLVRLCRPVHVVQVTGWSAQEVMSQLRRSADLMGVVVQDGKRVAGWIPRAALEQLAESQPNAGLASASEPATLVLTPEATVQEAVRSLCERGDGQFLQAVLVVRGVDVVGAVPIRDLLRAAVSEQRSTSNLRAPLTGLPARVRADQHLEEMICRGGDAVVRQSRVFHADAAIVDLRGFGEYNSVMGYEAGDRLIREVSDLVKRHVGCEGDVFVAHLGDDRFMVTGPAGELYGRLQRVINEFDAGSSSRASGSMAGRVRDGHASAVSIGLRVLLMPRVLEHVRHPRDVYRMEQQLRQRAKSQEGSLPPGRSLLLVEAQGEAHKKRIG